MHIACLETKHASVSVATSWSGVGRGELGPQMHKFKQVSSDHQVSLVGESGRSPGLMSGRSEGYPTIWLIPFTICIWCYKHLVPPTLDRQVPVKTLPSCVCRRLFRKPYICTLCSASVLNLQFNLAAIASTYLYSFLAETLKCITVLT